MISRRLRFAAYDHNGHSRSFVQALLLAGHEFVAEGPADLLLIDLDPPHPLPHRDVIDRFKDMGAKIVLYPHGGGGPMTCYDSLYDPYERIDVNLVTGPGHAEFLRRTDYPHEVHSIGWTFCEQAPFRPCADVRRVLYAPMHPNGDGSMPKPHREANADVFRRLLETPFELTVRHIGTLEQNGLWEADGVEFVNGRLTPQTAEIDQTDAVVSAAGTFPTLAIARGVPTVMYALMRPNGIGLPGETLVMPRNIDRYDDFIRYPFNAEDGPLEETIRTAALAEAPIADWKRRFVGEPFNPAAFVSLIERIALGGPTPLRLDPTRSFTTVAFADELLERPELLAEYTAAVTPEDDASLVLWAPGVRADLLLAMAQAAIDASGVDADELPDILLAPLPGSPAADRLLAERADALLSDWPRVGRLGELPRFVGYSSPASSSSGGSAPLVV
ncbi:MAG TPA: hypothetical protein VFZ00_31545 [Solirubrobacter sp.]|nr:hypothetical protein [Solirubrobacter sp.]